MIRFLLALSVASVTGLVYPVKVSAAKEERVERALLDQFFEGALKTGEDFRYPKGLGLVVGIEPGAPTKAGTVSLEDATDMLNHNYEVVLKSGKEPRPFCYIFRCGRVINGDSRSYYFKIWPDGMVDEKVMISHGRYQNGHGIRGSGHAEWTTLHAQGIYAMYEHALNFWLKGMYRKPSQTAESFGATGSVAPGAGQ